MNCAMFLACAMLAKSGASIAQAPQAEIDMGWIAAGRIEYLGVDGVWRREAAVAMVACDPVRHPHVREPGYCLVLVGVDGKFWWVRGARPVEPTLGREWSTFDGRPLLIYDDARGAWVRP